MGKRLACFTHQEEEGVGGDAGFDQGVGAKGAWKGVEEVAEGENEVDFWSCFASRVFSALCVVLLRFCELGMFKVEAGK
jgi:hypothetical protein